MTEKQKIKGLYILNIIRKSSLLLIICIIFFGIVFSAGKISADDFRRTFVRIANGFTADGENEAGQIVASYDPTMCIRRFKDGVAIATSDRLRIFDSSGIEFYSNKLTMSEPVVRSGNKRLLVFDRSGSVVEVYTSFANIGEISTEGEVINASINDKGSIAVVSQSNGYKSMVTVYNANLKENYKYYSADNYIIQACVYGLSKQMSCASLLIGGDSCKISSFDTSSEEAVSSVNISAGFVYHLEYVAKDKLLIVADTGWYLEDTSTGTMVDSYEYSGGSLLSFDISDSRGIFAFSDNGNRCNILVCDFSSGSENSFSVNGKVDSLAQNGDKIAILSSDNLLAFDLSGIELYNTESDAERIVDISGSYIIIQNKSGVRYIKM